MIIRSRIKKLGSRCKTIAATLGVILLIAAHIDAAPLRVVTWDLQPKTSATTGDAQKDHVQDAAIILKALDPDIIFLQHVIDWQSCNALIKALQPTKYHLAVCSSFRDPKSGALSKSQVAILSKTRAILSWSDAWKGASEEGITPLGFAFAAIRIQDKNMGCFSVGMAEDLADDASNREKSVRQLLGETAALRNWTANRVDTILVAGDFGVGMEDVHPDWRHTLQLLNQAHFANTFLNIPHYQRVTFSGNAQYPAGTRDYIFSKDAGLVSTPKITRTDWSEHFPVACEFDLDMLPIPAPSVATAPAPVTTVESPAKISEPTIVQTDAATKPASAPVSTPSPSTAATPTPLPAAPPVLASQPVIPPGSYNVWLLAGAISGGILLVVLIWRLGRRMRPQPVAATRLTIKAGPVANISLPNNAERVVITHPPNETTGSAGRPIIRIETAASSHTQSQSQIWQRRAEEAERRAERATEVVRSGLMPHLSRWLKDKLTRKLVSDRAQLMETQRAAALKLLAVDDRLAKIESQLQQRDRDYERRIDELTHELAVAKEENRELIRAKIALVRAEMERERAKAAAQKPEDSLGQP